MTLDQQQKWQIAQDTQACFGTEIGKRVLAQLRKDFGGRTSFNTNARVMSFLEGERHVLLTIEARLNMRPQDFIPPTPQEDDDHA